MLRNLWNAAKLLSQTATMDGLQQLFSQQTRIRYLQERFPTCMFDAPIFIHGDHEALLLHDAVRIGAGTVIAFDAGASIPALTIQQGTYVGEYCNIRVAAATSVQIGEKCLISQFVSIVSANHAVHHDGAIAELGVDLTKSGVVIGAGAWIGVGATILPGVTIGAGAVVGANSVVTSSIPHSEVWAGSPAKKIGARQLL